MEEVMEVNGRGYRALSLLEKGKGGYSCPATDGEKEYVFKQIHREPCGYYQFGDKLAAELGGYEKLCRVGVPELYAAGLHIGYFPTNFISRGGRLYYVDYECRRSHP